MSKERIFCRSRLSSIFCDGYGRPGRVPSTEPRCAARASRSRACPPAACSGRSRRLLPLPVAPWMSLKSQFCRQRGERIDDVVPVRFVAAFERPRFPADLAQHVRHGARALAAAPAIDEGFPGPRFFHKDFFNMKGNVLRHQRRAELLRLEGRELLVDRADARALLVVEDGAGDRARDVVVGELGGRARVDDGVESREGRGLGWQAEARDAVSRGDSARRRQELDKLVDR